MKIKKKPINANEFKEKVGRDPVDDDLDRCNCPSAGMVGHFGCGWCYDCDLPKFMCRCENFGD